MADFIIDDITDVAGNTDGDDTYTVSIGYTDPGLNGGAGDDTYILHGVTDFVAIYSSEGNDQILWDDPADSVQFFATNDPSGIVADLAAGTIVDGWGDTDTVLGIFDFWGTPFDDSVIASGDRLDFRAGGGDDRFYGTATGTETLVLAGNRTDYEVSQIETGWYIEYVGGDQNISQTVTADFLVDRIQYEDETQYLSDPRYWDVSVTTDLDTDFSASIGSVITRTVDLNGDGSFDLVVSAQSLEGPQYGAIYFNDGNNSFTLADGDRPLSEHGREILVADFNGDGILDLFISDHGHDEAPFPGYTNQLLLGTGTGFTDVSERLGDIEAFDHNSAIGDVDGDGDIDILVTNFDVGAEASYFLINDGAANFTITREILPADENESNTWGSHLVDLNNDGLPEMVIGRTGGESGATRVYWNEGGSFSADNRIDLPNDTSYVGVTAGDDDYSVIDIADFDIDGDGYQDLLIVSYDAQFQGYRGLQLLMNDGNGGFVDETIERLGEGVQGKGPSGTFVDFFDVNNDGYTDIVLQGMGVHVIGSSGGYEDSDNIYLALLNDGTGHYTQYSSLEMRTAWLQLEDPPYSGTMEFGVDPLPNADGTTSYISTSFDHDMNLVFTVFDPLTLPRSDESLSKRLIGNDRNDNIMAAEGNDFVSGKGGDDTLHGGEGSDTLVGGAGADVMSGGDGDDTIWAGAGDLGDDTVDGGTGNDVIGGGAGDDRIVGSLGADVLFGGAGDDRLYGHELSDTSETVGNQVWAGAGNDTILGADGADALGGGDGDDFIEAAGGNDRIYAGKTGNDTLDGGAGNDLIFGGTGNDNVIGGAGADEIYGGAGEDTVSGGADNDTLYGGAGNDTLNGGEGDDILFGGADADIFIFAIGDGDDQIGGFSVGEDVIDLSSTAIDFTNLASVQAVATETDDGLLVDLGGGDSVVLLGIALADLSTESFIY